VHVALLSIVLPTRMHGAALAAPLRYWRAILDFAKKNAKDADAGPLSRLFCLR
jgi:hypothetical protein